MFYRRQYIILILLCLFSFAGITSARSLGEPILPIPIPVFSELEKQQIALGRRLFSDVRLSADNTISCASCHRLELGGVDRQMGSTGIGGVVGDVNAPTVINSGLNFVQFWDGRAETLEEQAAGPVHNPIEMGSNWDEVLKKLNSDAYYAERFPELYEKGMTGANIQHAIATFERSLVSVNSPFDQYLRGDKTAISDDVKEGYRLFKSFGCVACHQGSNVGGNMFARLGVLDDFFQKKGQLIKADMGRYNVTGEERDKHAFKVPSLRLVTQTAPYFHDGSIPKLEDAVRTMAKYQLGRRIKDEEISLIITFLEALAGELYEVEP